MGKNDEKLIKISQIYTNHFYEEENSKNVSPVIKEKEIHSENDLLVIDINLEEEEVGQPEDDLLVIDINLEEEEVGQPENDLLVININLEEEEVGQPEDDPLVIEVNLEEEGGAVQPESGSLVIDDFEKLKVKTNSVNKDSAIGEDLPITSEMGADVNNNELCDPFVKDIKEIKIIKKAENEEKFIQNIEHSILTKLIERYHLKCLKGSLYLYMDNGGYFIELDEYQIRTLVRTGWSSKVEALLSKSRVDDIIDRLRSYAPIQILEDDLDSFTHLINFNDCVLDVKTEKVLKHSPDYCFTSFINANYCKKESPGINFLNFINKCTNGDELKVRQIQELFGYVVSNFSNAKKWFVLIGQPHTGKSTILDLLTDIIGEEYTSNVPLHELGAKFALADLFKKKLNVCGELNEGVLKNISTIKAITGNDRLRADRKYKIPIFFINRAKIIMAGNSMFQLQTLDNTSAFVDRILFLVFNNTIPANERDYKLKEKLLMEKDFIVRWAVKGLKRLIKNNFIFTESVDSIEFKKQYKNEMSNINDFITSFCILEPSNEQLRVHKKDLYDVYIYFCKENCQSILSKKEFFNEFKKLPVKQSKFRFRKSNPLDGYLGITLKKFLNQ